MKREPVYVNSLNTQEGFDSVGYNTSVIGHFWQEELSYEQFYKVIDVLSEDVKDGVNKLKKFDYMNIKLGQDKLIELLGISTGLKKDVLKSFKKSEIKILVDDFFFLNPDLKDELASLCQIAALGMMTSSYVSLEESLETSLRVSFDQHAKTVTSPSQARTSRASKKRRK